jgi:hypothetical protein
LPDNKGTLHMTLRVTGPLAFLVAKSQALVGPTARDKPKDAYDIVWLIESWPGGPTAAAAAFADRQVYDSADVHAALRAIENAFERTDSVGPRSYARFVATSVDEEPQLERRAVGAVAQFAAALPPASSAH